jgi:hypothetical protein
MKIGNSTIQFNMTIRTDVRKKNLSLQDVPYWRLYARKGDCIGTGWKSDRVLTYDEIVEYLTRCSRHRVLEAYPRFSKRVNDVYYYTFSGKDWLVINNSTGEVLCEYDTITSERVYLSDEYKSKASYFKKKFEMWYRG